MLIMFCFLTSRICLNVFTFNANTAKHYINNKVVVMHYVFVVNRKKITTVLLLHPNATGVPC